jgi:hypothetical protein
MIYEIDPVANGFILRIYDVAMVSVGYSSYPLGRTLVATEIYATINAAVAAIRDKVNVPAPAI